jgi:hypothetical protein
MARITNDEDGGKILNLPQHRQLYKATKNGDLFAVMRGKLHERGWGAIESDTMRRHVWKRFDEIGFPVAWREANGEDIAITNFRTYQGQICLWYICEGCDALWKSSPENVDRIRHGCHNENCVHYPKFESVIIICHGCQAEIYDTHGEIVTCPHCAADLSRP